MLSLDSFEAMGTMNTVVVDDVAALAEALAMVKAQVREIDATCSRFRPDSELSRLNRHAGEGEVTLSPLMKEALLVALQTAEMTGGLVDPTVGKCVEDVGYTVTFGDMPADGPPLELRVCRVFGWRSLRYDPSAHTLDIPGGVSLDLGASGKAWAADKAATVVAEVLGIGVMVECGGDVAVRGRLPEGGWPVRIAADVSAPEWEDVVVHDGGLATSGTTTRRWRRGGIELHDIIDPASGQPAQTPWTMVTVAAATCVEANAAATASLIMGERAPAWLDGLGLPARLVRADGGVRYAGGWTA
ncbi:MAG TPA: FAD:protein FMN transferase [Gemmatimonadales bacterium]|nr:FAD:protein FMN transferase [Gemmatimonadales bacterium]